MITVGQRVDLLNITFSVSYILAYWTYLKPKLNLDKTMDAVLRFFWMYAIAQILVSIVQYWGKHDQLIGSFGVPIVHLLKYLFIIVFIYQNGLMELNLSKTQWVYGEYILMALSVASIAGIAIWCFTSVSGQYEYLDQQEVEQIVKDVMEGNVQDNGEDSDLEMDDQQQQMMQLIKDKYPEITPQQQQMVQRQLCQRMRPYQQQQQNQLNIEYAKKNNSNIYQSLGIEGFGGLEENKKKKN